MHWLVMFYNMKYFSHSLKILIGFMNNPLFDFMINSATQWCINRGWLEVDAADTYFIQKYSGHSRNLTAAEGLGNCQSLYITKR